MSPDKELYLTDVMSLFSLKGSSGDHSFHSPMEYGQFPFPSTSVSQDNLFQERSYPQSKQNLKKFKGKRGLGLMDGVSSLDFV